MTPVRLPRRHRAARGRLGLGLLAALIAAGVLSGAPSGSQGLLPTRTVGMTVAAPVPGTVAAASGREPASVQPPASSGQAPAGGSAPPPAPPGPAPAATSGSSAPVPGPTSAPRSATRSARSAAASASTTPSTTSAPPGITLVPGAPGTPAGSTPPAGAARSTETGQGQAGCGLLDVGCHVTSAINGWFTSVVKAALAPILALLGRSVLATPDVTGPGGVADLWGAAAAIANTVVVLLVLAGGAVVMGHETVQTRYAAKDIAPRMVLAVIAANASLPVAGMAIALANSLSAALLGPGVQVGTATGAAKAANTASGTSRRVRMKTAHRATVGMASRASWRAVSPARSRSARSTSAGSAPDRRCRRPGGGLRRRSSRRRSSRERSRPGRASRGHWSHWAAGAAGAGHASAA